MLGENIKLLKSPYSKNLVDTLLVCAWILILCRFFRRFSEQVSSELHAHADVVHQRCGDILFGSFEYVHNIAFPIRRVRFGLRRPCVCPLPIKRCERQKGYRPAK